MSILRLTGTVVSLDLRSGTSQTGQPYSFRIARVMVPLTDFVEVVVGERFGVVAAGDVVDWFVRVTPKGTGRLRIDAYEAVPQDFAGAA
jgi:hypothetical protein